MKKLVNLTFGIAVMAVVLVSASVIASAQKLPKSIYVQATASGQGTQLGRTFNVTLIIEELSTPEDQQALLGAFTAKGNEGLVNALTKMSSKGRMMITGTLGYDVNYIRAFSQPDGSTKYRLVTNRPITFGEAWSDSRSMDYNLSAIEVVLAKDKKQNSGVMYPAAQLKLDKDNQIEIELRMNEWKLVNVMKR